jgi:hypothetical protein
MLALRMVKDPGSHALTATLPCSQMLGKHVREAHREQGERRDSKRGAVMAHLLDRHALQRANTILMLGMLWSGLAACVLAALAYDFTLWLGL